MLLTQIFKQIRVENIQILLGSSQTYYVISILNCENQIIYGYIGVYNIY